ncbi:hypothetical protein, partial [Methylobacterium radiotolerans]|uniref:hypothetical protein n=1 Tax=Methylobacterium radiotolerans TaxID=31998 RepID=UPI001AECAD7C
MMLSDISLNGGLPMWWWVNVGSRKASSVYTTGGRSYRTVGIFFFWRVSQISVVYLKSGQRHKAYGFERFYLVDDIVSFLIGYSGLI